MRRHERPAAIARSMSLECEQVRRRASAAGGPTMQTLECAPTGGRDIQLSLNSAFLQADADQHDGGRVIVDEKHARRRWMGFNHRGLWLRSGKTRPATLPGTAPLKREPDQSAGRRGPHRV